MNSDQLLKFKAISDFGTLTKAAESLYISQPALSYTLSTLEKELGCNLFNREKNNLVLNENGKLLLPYAEQMSALLSRAEFALEEQNKIKLSSNNICAAFLLACVPQEYIPDIQLIQDDENTFGEMLMKGTLDVATCDDLPIKSIQNEFPNIEFERHILCREELGVIVHEGHPFYKRSYLKYTDLRDLQFCMMHDNQSFILWLQNLQKMYDVRLKIIFSMDHYTHYYLRDKIDYPEIAIRNTIVRDPIHEKARKYKFIPLKDQYSSRSIYMWSLKDNIEKVSIFNESIKKFYSTASPLRRAAYEIPDGSIFKMYI